MAAVTVVPEQGPAAWAAGRDSESMTPGCATAPVLEGVRWEVEEAAEAEEALAEEAAEVPEEDAAAEAGAVTADAAAAVGCWDFAAEGI